MVEIYCDGADLATIPKYAADPNIAGFTTNPSLMRKAGITHYTKFAQTVLAMVSGKPVSFEVLADDWKTMYEQAQRIQNWADNVYVKVPITNTHGESSIELIDSLSDLNLNITAVMTHDQLDDLETVVRPHHIVSVFAGRIMDAGKPVPPMQRRNMKCKTLWASTRELANLDMAEHLCYDIITMTPDLIAKLPLLGKDLKQYSLETVQQFYNDGRGIEF